MFLPLSMTPVWRVTLYCWVKTMLICDYRITPVVRRGSNRLTLSLPTLFRIKVWGWVRMTVWRDEAVRVGKGWPSNLLSNVCGERQLPAELAAIAAVAVTGRLELARLLNDGQSLGVQNTTDFQTVRSSALLSTSVCTNHNVNWIQYVHTWLCLYIIIILIPYCCSSWLGKSWVMWPP